MKKIIQDIKNNLYIVNYVQKTSKFIFVIIVFSILFELVMYYISTNFGQWIFDSVNVTTFQAVVIFIFVVNLSMLVPRLITQWFNMYSVPFIYMRINEKMMKALINKIFEIRQQEVENPIFFDKYSRAISEIERRPGEVMGLLQRIVGGFFELILVVFLISRLNIYFTLIFLVATLLSTIVTVFINKKEYDKYIESTKFNRKLGYVNRIIYQQEFGPLLRNNITFNPILTSYYHDGVSELKAIIKKYHPTLYLLHGISSFISLIFISISPWLAIAYGLFNQTITVGEATVILSCCNFLPDICNKLLGSLVEIKRQSLYISNLREVMEYKQVREHGELMPAKDSENIIATQDLAFSYLTHRSELVLCQVNLEIKKNEKIALVGPNGAGKSTLVNIIAGLYSPTEGKVFLFGNNEEKLNLETLNENIIICNQNAIMLAFTIAENVLQRPVNGLEDYKLVEDALKKVGMYDKVMSLKNGMDTYCSREFEEDGALFSGGEVQKLAIARVYVSKTPIVIMDEPTSALDAISEQEIMDLLFELLQDRTLIIISHRLAYIKKVDRIFYMDKGQIVEEGTHKALMEKKGLYEKLYTTQSQRFSREED